MASTVDELDLYEKYLALSDKLRIAEEDKTKWVCDKVATALAARDKQIKLEKERIELEKERRDKEIELEKGRREHELKIWTLKQTVSHTDNAESAGLSEKPSKKPRFPQDIDVYLDNFSRHATASKWPQREWPSIRFILLQGEALTVLLSLSDADRECYEKAGSCNLCSEAVRPTWSLRPGYRHLVPRTIINIILEIGPSSRDTLARGPGHSRSTLYR
ncbi:hypothetical protein PoB_006077500 [Plakobranchus ocellatus]|uniref:Uncharacterized protein n=1 Tax=Plakobranchus ocellatus TaxID=259542 RepID=A0AAV4CR08_9GAST|nr:hypothetical protein PoB_006077500 [Plakobranchus ocellatus]